MHEQPGRTHLRLRQTYIINPISAEEVVVRGKTGDSLVSKHKEDEKTQDVAVAILRFEMSLQWNRRGERGERGAREG